MGCSASRPSTTLLTSTTKTNNNNSPHPVKEDEEEEYPSQSQCSHFSSPLDVSVSKLSWHHPSSSSSSSYFSSPTPTRAFSLHTPLIHHPPSRKGDSHHLVSLTSSTYGSLLLLEPINPDPPDRTNHYTSPPRNSTSLKPPKLLDHPVGDSPLSPDSVINTWELMNGLDELDSVDFESARYSLNPTSPLSHDSLQFSSVAGSFRDLGSDRGSAKLADYCLNSVKSEEEIVVEKPVSSSKPLWKHLSEESFLSKMDPNVVTSYMRALSSRQLGCNNNNNRKDNSVSRWGTRSVDSSPVSTSLHVATNGFASPSHAEDDKIVLYFTSLRGIRKTYEDCCTVRMIFRGFRVLVDERDISMDSAYRKELQNMLKGKAMRLPQVFIRGKHIGGVEEIRQLNEAGELAKLLGGFPVRNPSLVCEACGDARFVPCPNCNGSRKVFDVEEEQLGRCPHCNENGLIRCPGCCS